MSKPEALAEAVTRDIVGFIMEDNGLGLEAAMSLFYDSVIFEKLCDAETGLYLEGPAYVYGLFKDGKGVKDP